MILGSSPRALSQILTSLPYTVLAGLYHMNAAMLIELRQLIHNTSKALESRGK